MAQNQSNILVLTDELRERVNTRLQSLIEQEASNSPLADVMSYTVLAPGKRLRPLICMISAQCLGGRVEDAIDPACAIELIHTASLMVDDLPCMDDAEMRRGKVSCHRRFGEAATVLVSLELLSLAYRVMSEAPNLNDAQRNRLVQSLARAVGMKGLIGGQEQDLAAEKTGKTDAADSDMVTRIHELKTGALFVAAGEAGGIVAGHAGDQLLLIREFAAHLGLAYQTFDDLIDKHASPKAAGKDVQQDADKPTLVGLLGSEAATDYAQNMIVAALAALKPLGDDSKPLQSLVEVIVSQSLSVSSSTSSPTSSPDKNTLN
jgi:geranylgeranyl diphosphate synthase type II